MARPRVVVCIPHWQVRPYVTLCLRSIRKHSARYDLGVLVVDNGSKDDSLDYLRSLSWIRLVERPEEGPGNWPANVFSAWDVGVRQAEADLFLTMHTDVFVKADDWLDPFLERFADERVAAVGGWKLPAPHPLYALQKRFVGAATRPVKRLLGRTVRADGRWRYPRDYCAMYRRRPIVEEDLSFSPPPDRGGGQWIAQQLVDRGWTLSMIPLRVLGRRVVHVAHGTAALAPEKRLRRARAQGRLEDRVARLLDEPWVRALAADDTLDR